MVHVILRGGMICRAPRWRCMLTSCLLVTKRWQAAVYKSGQSQFCSCGVCCPIDHCLHKVCLAEKKLPCTNVLTRRHANPIARRYGSSSWLWSC
eukprot:6482666-Amphidinium_carterae.1